MNFGAKLLIYIDLTKHFTHFLHQNAIFIRAILHQNTIFHYELLHQNTIFEIFTNHSSVFYWKSHIDNIQHIADDADNTNAYY